MNIKFGKLIVEKSIDYKGQVAKALEDAGFILVKDTETCFEVSYVVAKVESEDE